MKELAMLKYAVALLPLVIAGCASTTATAPSARQLADDGNGRTCRSYRETGSIMPGKRICHTAAEWQAIDRQQQQETNTLLGNTGRQKGTGGDLN